MRCFVVAAPGWAATQNTNWDSWARDNKLVLSQHLHIPEKWQSEYVYYCCTEAISKIFQCELCFMLCNKIYGAVLSDPT
jgi:hypothetical protein